MKDNADANVPITEIPIERNNTRTEQTEDALLKAGALQSAIFNSANFSSIATDVKDVIPIFNVGAERMLGYAAADVVNKITPADIKDGRRSPQCISLFNSAPEKPLARLTRTKAIRYTNGARLTIV
jgi:hypothetical protein